MPRETFSGNLDVVRHHLGDIERVLRDAAQNIPLRGWSRVRKHANPVDPKIIAHDRCGTFTLILDGDPQF